MYMNHVKVDIIWDRLIIKHDMYFVIVDSFIPFLFHGNSMLIIEN